jgi:serine/threonine protein kinase
LKIGKFFVKKILGKGTFGTVYLVQDSEGKHFVLKVSLLEYREMLMAEFGAGRLIIHPCIVPPLEFFEDGVFCCLLFEYVPSLTLKDYLETKRPSNQKKMMLVYQLVLAIAHLHFVCKIAHLDLKPDNILVVVDETGVPKIKIIDFGLASFFKDFKEEPKGTPHWMAPEVARGDYDEKADIWSLGKIIAWMFTGKNIFLPGNNLDLVKVIYVANIFTPPIPDQLKTNPKLASVLQLCEACLKINPELRASAIDLMEMCALILRSLPRSLPRSLTD